MNRLSGKVALITGGAMGMGAAFARAFVAESAKVVIADIAAEEGLALVDELGADNALFVPLNVTDAGAWNEAVKATLEHFGKLNVLVNNAGVFTTGSLEEYTTETWDKTIAINLTGPFLGIKAALAALTASAPSSIVNISSTAGLEGNAGFSGYSASKFGLRGLTRSAALELAERDIRVNSVHPGGVATPLLAAIQTIDEAKLRGSTLNRFALPEEIAGLVVFLVSDESSYCSGAEFVADGGLTAGKKP
ncbi:TPA: SDR family NAD(P)-dependent oxidoreductase [Serratia marcescens]|uniref:SDR family NAD(P)-dependent oxidoreductase n=1 Tax=Serratia nevei TaxID=2703794 RepID=UPI00313CD698